MTFAGSSIGREGSEAQPVFECDICHHTSSKQATEKQRCSACKSGCANCVAGGRIQTCDECDAAICWNCAVQRGGILCQKRECFEAVDARLKESEALAAGREGTEKWLHRRRSA